MVCLIVEDDAGFASLEARVVREAGGEPVWCATLHEAARALAQRRFDLVLLDNHLPDGRAFDWYDTLCRRDPQLPVVGITGLPDLAQAVALTRNGLFDYLVKPVDASALAAVLERVRRRRPPAPGGIEAPVWGDTPVMRAVREQLAAAARHRVTTVLLTGESGTGKEVAARELHRMSFGARAGEVPFLAVNCAAVPAEMFEAELFGAERGAYTGAERRRAGLAEAAQGGTLFLDEIGEVPLLQQAKLLRFLESREFRPLGSTEARAFTGRLVAATNRDLRAEVATGRFREDLLFRLEVCTVRLPPLRERRADIPALVEQVLAGLARRYERTTPWVRPEDLERLQQHHFPGNIRELRNILERSLLRTPEGHRWLVLDPTGLEPARPPVASGGPSVHDERTAPHEEAEPLPPERQELTLLEAQEYRLIRRTLRETHGGIRRAAARLGISPQALLRRLEKWPELRAEWSG